MIVPPRTVLVVVTRRIGDVLLATPLLRSLKLAWPAAHVDVLVFEGTEGALAGNPDVHRVIAVPERPSLGRHVALLARLLRRYDLALSLLPGDRPTLYAFLFGRFRAGLLIESPADRIKQRLLNRWVRFDGSNTHTVRMHLALAQALGIAPCGDVIVRWRPEDEEAVNRVLGSEHRPLAVLHPFPKFNYKMWSRAGWIELASWLAERGYRIVLSGGAEAAEITYVGDLAHDMPADTLNAAGRLRFAGSACLVSRARIYVGPDTALTHAAAALGVPTVALYGPSNPVKWGPWPRAHEPERNPWRRLGTQRVGNVVMVQGTQFCTPCLLEGCGRKITSYSDCLQQLPAARVMAAIEALLKNQTSSASLPTASFLN